MKKSLIALFVMTSLAGCEDATKAIDQAQEAANSAVDNFQEQLNVVDLSDFNLDQLGSAADSAQELASAIEDVMNMDLSNPESLVQATEHISNAYSCLVEASSDTTADKLIEKVMNSISNEDALNLIEQGVEKAKAAQECVM
ncbi:hypothetical protein TUMSATVNIG1_13110 [Vibrio nigripulchritudo]|uniref:hypothetical protein n=1 Tax=Vibrio nigripulchritudo TaxID=28173 RepID=UPI00190AA8DD|nr:hypothetical protein [Vibrio nigripulchritudo]BCL69366.1 hypothetical protein VNTUMSATTG_13030 [Vibrio nigripulchritudo]BDU30702.1 hypothetical protein TUMSATVNIG1_13110 [Vibrio nigripulchritudo]